jgi:CRP-like cAMP-binding protein
MNRLEDFRPKLRSGRVIPQGARIIFETSDPYNQIVLPMALADLILLCSGQFTVREIIQKIYKKQGAVPFRSLLMGIHLLHQGGFFENGDQLSLSSHLQSWMKPRNSQRSLSWTFKQRLDGQRRYPMTYYALTLGLVVTGLLGLQMLPVSPIEDAAKWMEQNGFGGVVLQLVLLSSTLQTIRHGISGLQLYLLTGKVFNLSLRLSVWGGHLHVGDEAADLSDNRLFTSMYYISQILMGWTISMLCWVILPDSWLYGTVLLAAVNSLWELNPFTDSEGRKLVKALILPNDGDVVTWHFEANSVPTQAGHDLHRRELEFARICALWGAVWLLLNLAILHETAITFGPSALAHIIASPESSWRELTGLGLWLVGLYFVVQGFIETVIFSLLRPYLKNMRFSRFKSSPQEFWKPETLLRSIEHLPLFSHLYETHLLDLIKNSEMIEFKRGAFIILENQPAKDLFVLLRGEVEISRSVNQGRMEWITELGPVSVFGEAALVDDTPREANVRANSRCTVLRIPIQVLKHAARESQSVRSIEDFRNAILVNQFFASSPVFRSLSPASIEFLSHRGTLEYFDREQIVFAQGDSGDSLFLILRGSVKVSVHGQLMKQIGQGNFFGEIALIANIPRTATIETLEPSVFFRISAEAFWEVLVQHMDLGVFIETVSETRLREDLQIASPDDLPRSAGGSK